MHKILLYKWLVKYGLNVQDNSEWKENMDEFVEDMSIYMRGRNVDIHDIIFKLLLGILGEYQYNFYQHYWQS